jgi:hypothetical protein
MKKVLILGMLLGLLPTLAFAQRGRVAGGMGSSARTSNIGTTMSPNVGMRPNAVAPGHDGVAPNASTVGSHSKTVAPNATSSQTAKTVGENPKTVPDKVMVPDARGVGADTGLGPNQ